MRTAIQREIPGDITTVACSYKKPIPEDVDAVIIGGGTLIGASQSSLHTFLIKHDAKLAIVGCGFREYQASTEWKLYWDAASHISVRGSYTVKKLSEHGLDVEKINCIGDPIFLYESENYVKEDYMGVVQRGKLKDYIDTYLDELSRLVGFPVKKIGFSESQNDICDKLYDEETTYQMVCKSSFWFGNRLHPFALALINEIPAIGVEIEYMKMYDLCSSINYPYWVTTKENPCGVYPFLMTRWGVQMNETQRKIGEIRDNLKNLIAEFISIC